MTAVRSGNLQLKELSLSRALNKSTLDLEAGTNISLLNLFETFNLLGDDNLKTLDERTISELNEAEVFAT